MIGLKRGTVQLYEHDKEWESAAAAAVTQLKCVFGDVAKDIEHVGSTAIKHIKAKPILDIAVAVDSLDLVTPLIPKLQEAGFHHRHHEVDGDMLFVCGDFEHNILTHHIHVVKANSMEWINYVNFRNYLNTFPTKAKEYEAVKTRMMEKFPSDREAYTNGKTEFIRYTLRKALVCSYLGKTVTVKIDRPIGSIHPKHPDLIYPINYGYIPGVFGGDGEELDVYVLFVNQPLDEFTGKIIGIVHRENDVEDKLAAAPEGVVFHQSEIADAVHFQEQYYKSTVEALYQKSCGTIVYRKSNDNIEYLLLFQRKSQTWSFPKGHMESGETEKQTAQRELFEEIGLKAGLIPGFRESVRYSISDIKSKEVVLFLAEATGEPVIRESEIAEYRWVDAEQAKCLLYPEYRPMIDKVDELLKWVV
jgi:GrpB-like predicted nucleotidyltransferase (UPF0157 family)/8-oxo-dGTP pyrophosphatase MutT (NUDIX family)/inorganic pyrophosphatase